MVPMHLQVLVTYMIWTNFFFILGIPPENAMSPEDMNAASPPPPPPSKCMNSMENIGM